MITGDNAQCGIYIAKAVGMIETLDGASVTSVIHVLTPIHHALFREE